MGGRRKRRYLLIRSKDPASCLERLLELYPAAAGIRALYTSLDVIGIYDDIVVIGVLRELVPKARAIVAASNECHTVKVKGTVKAARRTAMSIRRRPT